MIEITVDPTEALKAMDYYVGDYMIDLALEVCYRLGYSMATMAKFLAPKDDGALQESITASKPQLDETGTVETVVSANKNYAAYVEYGTGIVGQNSPKPDLPPGLNITYRTVHMVKKWKKLESPITYHVVVGDRVRTITQRMGVVKMPDQDYWVYFDEKRQKFFATRGQPARPFMWPAYLATQKRANAITAEAARDFYQRGGVTSGDD